MKRPTTIKDPYKENQLFKQRALVAVIGVFILSAALVARLIYLQVDQQQIYTTLSNNNQMDVVPIAPTRGLIYDRNQILLAKNIPVFSLVIIPDKAGNLSETIRKLSKIIPITDSDKKKFYQQLKQKRRFDTITLVTRLDRQQLARFSVNKFRFPGVLIKAHLIRYYPFGSSLAPVLGYVGRINEQELTRVNAVNYSATDYIGKVGIEKYYEKQLHGKVGYQQVETDASGRVVRVLKRTPPIAGDNLYLTIDSGLQIAAEKALGEHKGAVVAIEPNTGEILAMVSSPSYNPNLFVQGISTKQYHKLQSSTAKPLFNRTLRGQYPFGSTIKPFLALEGLHAGLITPNYKIYDPGWFKLPNNNHIYRDWKKHGWVNVTKAITVSCDTYFYRLGVAMGINKIDEVLNEFGFGHETNIDMGEELPGLVPSPKWKLRTQGGHWYTGDTIISSIGQGYMLTTPLQLAAATAALAERGKRLQPHLLLKTKTATGETFFQAPISLTPIEFSPTTWQVVINAMQDVINSPHGTGRIGFVAGKTPSYTVAAKTGTAQVFTISNNRSYAGVPTHLLDNSLFIAFAPVNKPQIAIAVIVANSRIAPNVARVVMDYYFHHGQQHGQQLNHHS